MEYQYLRFSAEDFACDPDFINWIKAPTEELDSFWNAWVSSHPQKKGEVERARQIVLALEVEEIIPPEGAYLQVWANIITAIRLKQEAQTTWVVNTRQQRKRSVTWYGVRAAAVLLGVVLAGLYFFKSSDTEVLFTTRYGESRRILLPDNSHVDLNANSSLRYDGDLFSKGRRELWLDGEAFFAVTTTVDKAPFIVHTKDLQVKVLGTRFNVKSRRKDTKVVLDEGRVKLDLKGMDAPVMMNPGEMVTFSEREGVVSKEQVDPSSYTSWRNHRLMFNRTSLEEIATLLEETYGFEVKFEDEQLKQKFFTGSSSSGDVDELLDKLRALFKLDIARTDNVIIIKKKS